MSEFHEEIRVWKVYIGDMIRFSEKILRYTYGMNKEAFLNDDLTYDATLRNIELVGEAADNVPPHVREAYPHIEWKPIVATRHRVAHVYSRIIDNYTGVDDDIIWDIIQTDIPTLLPQLRQLLEDVQG